ncbi:MAG: NAD-dependent epimerase/dehydratase family protein [Sphingobacteriaceae bacterium]|nr:NAD-dependent epimerase/dehydratase family protein [Sphingobacteriaceae bacterium]
MVLVTGATGFVGEHVVAQLLARGQKVRALYRNRAKIGSQGLLNPIQIDMVDWVKADVIDYYALEDALLGITKVFHCAAFISYDPNQRDLMFETNIKGTANLINACLHQGVQRVLYVSSIAALGQAAEPHLPIDENASWKGDKGQSNYAISKFRAENEVWRGMEEGLEVAVVCPSVILGPGQVASGSNQLFRKVYQGLRFYSPGATGFVDVRDVANALCMLDEQNIIGKRYVLNGHNLSYQQLFEQMAAALQVKAPNLLPPRWMAEIGWRVNKLMAMLKGKMPFITRETVRSAYTKKSFGGSKILEKVAGFSYSPLEKTLADGAAATLVQLKK